MAIVLRTVSDSKAARADLAKLEASVNDINNSVQSVKNSFIDTSKAIAIAFGTVAVTKFLTKQIDEFTNLENRIKVATKSQDEFTSSLSRVKAIAISTRADLGSVASLYSRLSISADQIGASQSEILRTTELVSKSLKITGATAQETASTLQQFGQAMGSGTLAGDEFKSITENATVLAKVLANKFAKGSIENLREMAKEGLLIPNQVMKAIIESGMEIDRMFSQMKVTFEGAFDNLWLSLKMLLNSTINYFLSSTGDIADAINNLAKYIANFAEYFDYNMLAIKTSVLNAMMDSITSIKAFVKYAAEALGLVEELTFLASLSLGDILKNILDIVSMGAKGALSEFKAFYEKMSERLSNVAFIDNLKSGFSKLKVFVQDFFQSIKIKVTSIDVEKIFPNLKPVLSFVEKWAKKVEGWFFWIYDRVIGHSWVPDLVDGVIKWFGKLLGTPLDYINEFSKKVNQKFESIFSAFNSKVFTASLALSLTLLYRFRTDLMLIGAQLLPILGYLTAIAAVLATIAIATDKTAYLSIANVFTNEDLSIWDRVLATAKEIRNVLSFKIQDTTIVRMFKQMAGMKDMIPGQLFGRNVDTSAFVGSGKQRTQEKRLPMHDFINAFPTNWQVPITIAIASSLGMAINKIFDPGWIRTILLSALTTAWALFTKKIVEKKTLNDFYKGIAETLVDTVDSFIKMFWKKSVIFEPLGLLSLVLKTSVVFESAREGLLNAFLTVARAPTTAMLDAGRAFDRIMLRRERRMAAAMSESYEPQTRTANTRAAAAYRDAIRNASAIQDASGAAIGRRAAIDAARAGDVTRFGGGFNADVLRTAIAARRDFDRTSAAVRDLPERLQTFGNNLARLDERIGAITTHLQTRAAEFRQGMVNIGATAGGTIGGVAGIQLGIDMARGLTGFSGWAKVGLIMFTASVTQAIGAGIGVAAAEVLIRSISGIAGLIFATVFRANWWVLGATVLVTAFVGAYNLFKRLPEAWKAQAGATFQREMPTTYDITQKVVGFISWFIDETTSGLKMWYDVFVDKIPRILKDLYEIIIPTVKEFEELAKAISSLSETIGKTTARSMELKPDTGYGSWANSNSTGTRDRGNFFGLNKANGGFISGPGSGTSDSIPAMLSNGEFVVNAKSTSKFLPLLEKINSGSIGTFSAGGLVTGSSESRQLSAEEFMARVGKTSGKALEILDIKNPVDIKLNNEFTRIPTLLLENKNSTDAISVAIRDLKETGGLVKTPITPEKSILDEATKLFKGVSKSFPTAGEDIAKALMGGQGDLTGANKISADLAKYGYNIKPIDVSKFDQEISMHIENAMRYIDEQQKRMDKAQVGSVEFGAAKSSVEDWKKQLATLVKKAQISDKGGKLGKVSAADSDKTSKKDVLQLKDQLQLINEAFPEINYTLEEFYNSTDSLRNTLYESASEIVKGTRALDEIEIGKLGSEAKKNIEEKRKPLEMKRKAEQEKAFSSLGEFRSSYTMLKPQLDKLNISLSEEAYNLLSESELLNVSKLILGIKEAAKTTQAAAGKGVTQEARNSAQAIIKKNIEDINKATEEAIRRTSKRFVRLSEDLSKFGVNLDKEIYEQLSNKMRDDLELALKRLRDLDLQIDSEDETMRALALNARDQLKDSITTMFDKVTNDVHKLAKEAGKTFAENVSSEITNNFRDLMKGDVSLKEFAMNTLDNVTATIVDNFAAGIMQPFEDSSKKYMETIGTDIYSIGASIFGDKSASDIANTASQEVTLTTAGTSLQLAATQLMAAATALSGGASVAGLGGFSSGFAGTLAGAGTSASKIAESSSPLIGGAGMSASAKMFEGMSFKGATDKFASDLDKSATKVVSPESGIFSTFSDSFTGLFKQGGMMDKVGSFLSEGLSSVVSIFTKGAGFLGFANGGRIVGPGTGTSDSIMAAVSNGEFIVNAKAAKANLGLLTAINSGNMMKFADGGIVGSGAMIPPIEKVSYKDVKTNNAKSSNGQTVVNLNVTGDISRQTRAEIYKMLPSITDGVNSHNKERGYRG